VGNVGGETFSADAPADEADAIGSTGAADGVGGMAVTVTAES
jgi:hypothetical protein